MNFKKKYKATLKKENKTLYDQLFEKVYNEEASEFLKKYINEKQNKRIYNFDICLNKDNISISYSYKGYDIYFDIYNDKYVSYIIPPEKYDFIDERKELEKEVINNITINSFITLEDFCDVLYEDILIVNKRIDVFNKEIKPNELTNGKMLNKIEGYKYFCKKVSSVYILGGLFFGILFSIGLVIYTKDIKSINLEDILLLTMILGMIIIAILFLICGLYHLAKIIQINKDLYVKKMCKIQGVISKVNLIVEIYNKSQFNCLEAITITIKNDNNDKRKIICPIGTTYKKWQLDKKKIKQKYLGWNVRVLYLEKSRISLNGLSNIVNGTIKEANKAKK